MIEFNKEIDFEFLNEEGIRNWISEVVSEEGFSLGEVNYIFCSDEALLEKNIKFLNHNTLTDVIGFDYTMGKLISGDIFISIDRVLENAEIYKVTFEDELHRVIVHAVLHFLGYKDKIKEDSLVMKSKEDYYLNTRTFL